MMRTAPALTSNQTSNGTGNSEWSNATALQQAIALNAAPVGRLCSGHKRRTRQRIVGKVQLEVSCIAKEGGFGLRGRVRAV